MTSVQLSSFDTKNNRFIPFFSFGEDSSAFSVKTEHGAGHFYSSRFFGPRPDLFKIALWNPFPSGSYAPGNDPINNFLTSSPIFMIHIKQGYPDRLNDAKYVVVLRTYPQLFQSEQSSDSCIVLKFRDLIHHFLYFSRDDAPFEVFENTTLKRRICDIAEQSAQRYLDNEFFGGLDLVPKVASCGLADNEILREQTGLLIGDGWNVLHSVVRNALGKDPLIHIGSANELMPCGTNQPTNVIGQHGIIAAFRNPYGKSVSSKPIGRPVFPPGTNLLVRPKFVDVDTVWNAPVLSVFTNEDVRFVGVNAGDGSFEVETVLNTDIEPGFVLKFGQWNGRVQRVIHEVFENGVAMTRTTLMNADVFPWEAA